jgi:trk system potassium uptake protein TrkA
VPTASDAVVAEIPVPERFIGKTIQELDIRRDFHVSVLMIKQVSSEGEEELNTAPEPDYAFQEGDIMLVLGPSSMLPALRRGVPR